MIERFLTSCFAYLWQLLCLALPAAAVALIVLALTKKKKTAAAVLALCLLLELGLRHGSPVTPFFAARRNTGRISPRRSRHGS